MREFAPKRNLGDILVADPCWDWGSGKLSKEDGKEVLLAAPYQWRLNATLRSRVADLAADDAFLTEIYNAWSAWKPAKAPKAKIDAVATGGSVVGRRAAMDAIRKQHKNLIGVEMEIFAVLTAGEIASEPRPTCFAVKSVCDFGDEKKNNKAQSYAAYTSASFLKRLALDYTSIET